MPDLNHAHAWMERRHAETRPRRRGTLVVRIRARLRRLRVATARVGKEVRRDTGVAVPGR